MIYKRNPGFQLLQIAQTIIYQKVEIIGVAAGSIEAAIETALAKAQSSLDELSWFEVGDIRGHISPDGKVSEYQVVLKVAFELKG